MQLLADFPEWAEELFHPHRYKVVYGGRGAARSWSFARALLVLGSERPLRILCAREFQRSIADSVHRLLTDQIAMMKLPGYTITRTEIVHANGTRFLFEGLRYNITKIKSLEGLDICWVEEAEKVSKDSWDILIPTVRKTGSEIWISFNPDEELDATYQRFVINAPPSAWTCKVNWEDNPWFPEELREEKDYLYSVDPEAADWVWGGNPRKASDAQILKGKWRVESFTPDPDKWQGPFHGLDFGFAKDPTTLIRCWVAPPKDGWKRFGPRSQGRLMIESEAYKVGLELDDSIPFFIKHVHHGIMRYVVRADSARPESIAYLKRHGMFRIVAAVKWPGSIEDGIAYLRQFEEIVINPECKQTAQEAVLYSYKVDPKTSDVLPIPLDKHNHCWDAVRYALAPIIRAAKIPKSAYSGISYNNGT